MLRNNLERHRCRRCGKRGHSAEDCYSNFDILGNPLSISQPIRCFRCGGTGHLAVNCPVDTESNGKSKADGRCFRCGRKGHYAEVCYQMTDVFGNTIFDSRLLTTSTIENSDPVFPPPTTAQKGEKHDPSLALPTPLSSGMTTATVDTRNNVAINIFSDDPGHWNKKPSPPAHDSRHSNSPKQNDMHRKRRVKNNESFYAGPTRHESFYGLLPADRKAHDIAHGGDYAHRHQPRGGRQAGRERAGPKDKKRHPPPSESSSRDCTVS